MKVAVENLGCLGIEFREAQRPAVIDFSNPAAPREVSYASFHASCDAVAKGCVAFGLKPGDKVGLYSSNRVEFLEAFYGCMRAGVIPVMLGILLPQETIHWMIRDSDIKLVFCDSGLQSRLPQPVSFVDLEAGGPAGLESFKKPGPFVAFQPEQDSVAFQATTSGSTGKPKGVLLSHRAHSWVARTISTDRKFSPADRMIVAAPLYHKHAMNSIKCVLAGGSAVVLLRKFDAGLYLELITRYRITILGGVPTIFAMLLQQRELLAGKDYSFVRLVTIGGAPASDELIDSIAKAFPNAHINLIYGITEASAALFGSSPQGAKRPRHSIGWPLAGNEVRLVGGGSDNFGVLEVRSPGMMNGYHNNPAETAKRLIDGWFNTGDFVRRDEQGWYFFVGRSDDMFTTSGHNIYPAEVELVIERHPDVDQAIVVPAPDALKHSVPYAFVVARKNAPIDEAQIKQHVLAHAPPYQYPRKVIFLDALPMTGVGKIDRRLLEARASELVRAQSDEQKNDGKQPA